MPISPAMAEAAAEEIRRIYAEAERIVAEKIARRVARGIDEEGYYERKLAELQALRREVEAEIRRLQRAEREVERIVADAYEKGSQAAIVDLRKVAQADTLRTAFTATNQRAIEVLVRTTIGNLRATHLRILRQAEDVYRQVIAETAAPQVLTGALTRREAVQLALNRFADMGITGFVDRAGRTWTIESYAEMATRTAAGQAAVQGHIDRLIENDRDLVIVSDAPEECPLCAPWESRVLSLTGRTPGYPTVDQAMATGLFHPNCRHSLGAYIPGLTEPMRQTRGAEGYQERVQQRYMERQIRKWKLRESVAITEESRREARAKVRAWQARIREFVDEHDRKRLYYREQVGKAR